MGTPVCAGVGTDQILGDERLFGQVKRELIH